MITVLLMLVKFLLFFFYHIFIAYLNKKIKHQEISAVSKKKILILFLFKEINLRVFFSLINFFNDNKHKIELPLFFIVLLLYITLKTTLNAYFIICYNTVLSNCIRCQQTISSKRYW